MPRLWILKINKANVDDLNERGRVAIDSDEQSSMEPGQLVLTKFIKELGGEQANCVALYRITDVGTEEVRIEPVDQFNDQVPMTGDDWERLRFVPMSLRTMHVWDWNRTDDDRGLYGMVEEKSATREQVLDRCFVVRTETSDMAEDFIREHLEIRPYDRFLCTVIGEERMDACILEADLESNIGPLSTPVNNIPHQYTLAVSDIEQAAAESGYVSKLWDFIRGVEDITEVPYEDLSFYDVLGFKVKVEAKLTGEDKPWNSSIWLELMACAEADEGIARDRVRSEFAARRIMDLLAAEGLDDLTIADFDRYVFRHGDMFDADGEKIDPREIDVRGLRERLESGEWQVVGNQTVGQGANSITAYMSGMDEEEQINILRDGISILLHEEGDALERMVRAKNAVPGFGDNVVTLLMCMAYPNEFGIRNGSAKRGAERLAELLDVEDEWNGKYLSGDYRDFNQLLHAIRDHSGGAFEDLLEVDSFLHRMDRGDYEPTVSEEREALQAWFFQCNPDRWDLLEALQKPVPFRESWATNQHADKIRIGDTVYLWKSGEDAGIYGVAHVISDVYDTPGDEFGERKVDLIVEWSLDEPLLKGALQEDDRTSSLRIVTNPQGTNFRLKTEEDVAIREILGMPDECYYTLAAKAGGHHWQDLGLAYIYGVGAAGKPKQLTEDIRAEKAVNYLLYHTGGDTSHYGSFGRVLEIYPNGGAHSEQRAVLRLEGIPFEPPLSLSGEDSQQWRQKTDFFSSDNPINLRVVFPLTAQDYYAAIGAGFRSRPIAADFREAVLQHLPKAICEHESDGWFRVSGPQGAVRVRVDSQTEAIDEDTRSWTIRAEDVDQADFVAFYADNAGLGGRPCWLIASASDLNNILPLLPEVASDGRQLSVVNDNDALIIRRESTDLEENVSRWRNDFAQIGRMIGRPEPFAKRAASIDGETDVTSEEASGPGADVPTLADVAHACCCSIGFIEDIIAQLERKGQVIFFGPPGTGKTFVARKIAEFLAEGDGNRRELIQFHPSYTYEDFMEGIKPESRPCGDDRWEVSYPVRAGSFKSFCERASKDPENTYVFVIDEINRGQIAKIFGELMYLLEYRNDQIELAYTKSDTDERERFSIPQNVRIIGTMNTADRSIALVDFALRRRFTFIPFYPDEGDVQQMLPTWLGRKAPAMQWVGRLVNQFNAQLAEAVGRDYLVGHSYFMQKGLDEGLVGEIWRYQIEPLLHEYFIGTTERVREEFALDRLIRRAKGEAQPEGEGGEE